MNIWVLLYLEALVEVDFVVLQRSSRLPLLWTKRISHDTGWPIVLDENREDKSLGQRLPRNLVDIGSSLLGPSFLILECDTHSRTHQLLRSSVGRAVVKNRISRTVSVYIAEANFQVQYFDGVSNTKVVFDDLDALFP